MGELHLGIDSVLLFALGIIGYFLRWVHKKNEETHTENKAALQAIEKRLLSDLEILGVVNGKYVSRKEQDLVLRESETQHRHLSEKIETLSKEAAGLRTLWDNSIATLLSNIYAALERTR